LESSDPPEVDSVQVEESEFDSPEVEEKDLNNLTIPAVLFQSELSDQETIESDCEIEQHQIRTMTDETVAQRAYIKDIANAIPEFNGQKINLQRFITALKLVNLTKGTFEEIAVEVIKSKIVGSTLYKVQNESTINGIIKKLQDTIIGETSDVVKAKMAKTSQKGKTAEKFTTEVDNLRKLLEASYIDEGLPAEHADKFSTKEAINTMVKNCEHGRLKTILEAGNFSSMNEALTKYIQCSTEMIMINDNGNANAILFSRKGPAYRGNNFRSNYRGRGRGNGRGNYQNNGYYQYNSYNRNSGYNQNNGFNRNYNNQTNNYSRGRGNYRQNNNNQNTGNYGNTQHNNNVRFTLPVSGNSQTPLDTIN